MNLGDELRRQIQNSREKFASLGLSRGPSSLAVLMSKEIEDITMIGTVTTSLF